MFISLPFAIDGFENSLFMSRPLVSAFAALGFIALFHGSFSCSYFHAFDLITKGYIECLYYLGFEFTAVATIKLAISSGRYREQIT